MSVLEITANILNVLGVYLAARNKIATWPVGILGCILYGVMFVEVKLYADVTLQIFYIVTAVYGWFLWKRGGEEASELPVTNVRLKQLALYSVIGIATTLAYGKLLSATTDASYPFIDSLVMSFSVVAQLLMMRRKIESWPLWIMVNAISIALFISKGLYLTALVYGIFSANAVLGYFQWKKLLKTQNL